MKVNKLCRLLNINIQLDKQTNQLVEKDEKSNYTKAGQTGDVDSSHV